MIPYSKGTIFVIAFSVGFIVPLSLFYQVLWLGVACLAFVCVHFVQNRNAQADRLVDGFPIEFFTSFRIDNRFKEIALVGEEVEAAQKKFLFICNLFNFLLDVGWIAPGIGFFCCLSELLFAEKSFLLAWIAILLVGGNFLLILMARLIICCKAQKLKKWRRTWLQNFYSISPRRTFDPANQRNCNEVALLYPDSFYARVAVSFMRQLHLNFIVHPDDALLFVLPYEKINVLYAFDCNTAVGLQYFASTIKTFGELVRMRVIGIKDFPILPETNSHVEPPPPFPDALNWLMVAQKRDGYAGIRRGIKAVLCRGEGARPLYSHELFCKYWPTRREAEVAAVIQQLSVAELSTAEQILFYPNDPMILLVCWQEIAFDCELMAEVEKHFQIEFSTLEIREMFASFTFVDAVRKVITLLDTRSTTLYRMRVQTAKK